MGMYITVCGLEVKLQEFALSLYHVGPRDGTQAVEPSHWNHSPTFLFQAQVEVMNKII